jgi:hypothetical protein
MPPYAHHPAFRLTLASPPLMLGLYTLFGGSAATAAFEAMGVGYGGTVAAGSAITALAVLLGEGSALAWLFPAPDGSDRDDR